MFGLRTVGEKGFFKEKNGGLVPRMEFLLSKDIFSILSIFFDFFREFFLFKEYKLIVLLFIERFDDFSQFSSSF